MDTTTPKTATFVRTLRGFRGNAELFRLEPPLEGSRWPGETGTGRYAFVVASAARVFGAPETYMFGADEDGRILDWGELPPSQKGTLDIDAVWRDAGYAVVRPAAAAEAL
jgi:hypothetical protein